MMALAKDFRFLQGALRRWRYAYRSVDADRSAVPATLRLVLSALACAAAAYLLAIVVAIVDLYMVGDGHRSLLAPFLVFEPLGVALGVGDIAMLTAALAAAVATWHVLGRAWPEYL